jgi:hypothetical protein
MAVDPESVAREFVKVYYQTFTSNRAGLGTLYQPHSMLTFEGQQCIGSQAIAERLSSLPLFKVEPSIDTLDVQPSAAPGSLAPGHPPSMLICITGRLVIDNESCPQRFSQTFHLVAGPAGNYYVLNDVFRLNYG